MKSKLFKVGIVFVVLVFIVLVIYVCHLYAMKSVKVLDTTLADELGIEGIREHYKIPGFSYSVIKEGNVVKEGASGYIYQGSDKKVEIGDYFQIGSCTKAFTGLMAAKLVDEGKLNWDTKLFDLFPDWKENSNSAYYSVTLKELLSHRAQIQPFDHDVVDSKLPLISKNPLERRLEFCKYVLSLQPVTEKPLLYSNAGYSIAGIMLEKVTGKSWEELAKQTAKEIGIEIGFGRPNHWNINQPWGHRIGWFRSLKPVSPKDSYNLPFILAPAGDISMSISDASKYIQIYLKGIEGTDDYLKAETIEYLLFGIPEYSIGWCNNHDGDTYAFHGGSEGTYYSHIMVFKELKSAIIILTNAPDCEDTLHFIDDIRNYLKRKYIY